MRSHDNSDSPFMRLLKEKGLTTRTLARELNRAERTIFYWLAGKSEPKFTVAEIQKLCRVLDCTVFDLPTSFKRGEGESDDQEN